MKSGFVWNRRALPAIAIAALALASCNETPAQTAAKTANEVVRAEVLTQHDYSLANTPNKRTALAYLYTAWNDGEIVKARRTYWAPGSFPELEGDGPPPDLPKNIGTPKYTIKKVIEEGDQVAVLAFVEGVGIGTEITTVFGTSGGTKIGDAVVEIFRFDDDGLIAQKWDTVEPVSEASYDFR